MEEKDPPTIIAKPPRVIRTAPIMYMIFIKDFVINNLKSKKSSKLIS
jgi:hypothetical protein